MSVGKSSTPTTTAATKKKGLGAKRVVETSALADLSLDKVKKEIEKQREPVASVLPTAATTTSRYTSQETSAASFDDFFSAPIAANTRSYTSTVSTTSATQDFGTAQDRFKNAKGISSDQFFNKNQYDQQPDNHRETMSKFQNATSISSDAYFGKEPPQSPRAGAASSASNYSAGGVQAADFFSELTRQVKSDMQSLAQQAKEGMARYNRG